MLDQLLQLVLDFWHGFCGFPIRIQPMEQLAETVHFNTKKNYYLVENIFVPLHDYSYIC
jgi:hypothetical protein